MRLTHRHRMTFVSLIIAGVLSVPIAGIVAAQDADEDGERVLRVGFMQAVDNLSPMLGLNDAAYVFYGLVYDYMHTIGNDFEVVGNIAVESRIVPVGDSELVGRPYGSIWEYDITQNAMWHDGEPFTVDDFVWNMKLHSVNYDTMWAFQPYAYYIEDVKAVDADTARIYFFDRDTGEPMPVSYAYLMCIPMLPSHLLSTMNVPFISFEWTGVFADSDPPIVGTGPFMATDEIYEEWLAGDHITLVRNPDYHWAVDKDMEVKFDKIVMNFYDDATSMRIALTSGDLDIAQFPPETYKAIRSGVEGGSYDNVVTYDGPKCTQYWTEIEFCMNEGGPNPIRLDREVRQALAMATDKEYIVNNFYQGLADVGTTLIPPVNTEWHYEPTAAELFEFSMQAAGDKLDEAGYRFPSADATVREATEDSLAVQEGWVIAGRELEFEMIIRREYPEERLIAQYLKETWAALGVTLEYEVVDESYMGTLVYSYEYDTCIWYWSADVDPNYMLFCQSKLAWGGWSDNKYSSEAYEENYTASVMELDVEQRKVYVDNCQKVHYDDAPFIIMACPYQTYAWRTDTFEGWGDWENDPGRSMDNFWGGNPLFFDLEYIGDSGTTISTMGIVIAVGVAAAIVATLVVLRMMKKKKKGGSQKTSPLGE
jgi:peptide/nickel transport system substrate-binding protein